MSDGPVQDLAVRAGQELLAELGVTKKISGTADHPALAWRRSGLFYLSGLSDGLPKMVSVDLMSTINGAILALKSVSGRPENLPTNGALLLGERARLMDLSSNGRNSPGGHCRLIDAKDGRFALNLARDDDWGLLEAWLQKPASSWSDVEKVASTKARDALVDRGIELGLAIAKDEITESRPWFQETPFIAADNENQAPLVVDLSSLWAGPLASYLLMQMGARVVKVESLSRPDGARRGNAEFYELLNAGKRCAAFDFSSDEGRSDLKELITAADIVIEASRPRALQQLGIDADALMAAKPGKLWLRLTAYGADQDSVGFGDDIGAGAGLCSLMEKAWGKPLFVGDAIADPVSGIFGALAAWTKWTSGGGAIIDLSMRDTVRRSMQIPDGLEEMVAEWQDLAVSDAGDFYPLRKPSGKTEKLGESTAEIMAGLC